MTTIKYENNTVPALPSRFVKLTKEQLPSVPSRLAERICRKELTKDELAGAYYPRASQELGLFEAARFEDVEGTFVPNGNDVMLVGNTIIEFEPLVKIRTSLDMSYIVDKDGAIVDGSPMVDNHWMDEAAEREYAEMLQFIHSINN
ncbi:MAG: hypothetical protein ACRDBQ_18900 [Shewanella sp.]